jgi:hypothetical protein
MTAPPPERWVFTFELPADLPHAGRYMAALLKHLLRRWRIRAVAVREAPPDPDSDVSESTATVFDPRARTP